MRAVVYRGPGDIGVEERDVPELGAGDVLLEVSHCGVCGSDMHAYLDGWGAPGMVPGHEWSGTVVEVGTAVTGWAPGDLAVGGPSPKCGQCEYCLGGRPSLCTGRGAPGLGGERPGAFAEYHVTQAVSLNRVPEGLPLKAAALAEPLAVSLHALTQGQVEAGHRVLVTGGGPIGALAAAAALARGAREVVVSEPNPLRRALCEQLGATVIAPEDLVPPRSPDQMIDDAFDAAIEASGNQKAMEVAHTQLKRGGRLVLVGAGMGMPRFDNNRILLNEIVITGAFVYDADGFERALELLNTPGFPVDALIEADDVTIDDAPEVFARIAAGELAAKVMITPAPSTAGGTR
jgi:2-desacetyl-2-hydroxyethyl bacteriochlorophyllide A dehydrogenase